MRIPEPIRRVLLRRAAHIASSRPADFVIGPERGYLFRWHVIPRNRFANVYLHHIGADDDDRALHDHPWWNVSVILEGSYWEHLPGGIVIQRGAGSVVKRRATALHRIELCEGCRAVWSLFLTGPTVRTWGFQCPRGWKPWYEFVDARDKGRVGRGCD
jgi:hypothetical protein